MNKTILVTGANGQLGNEIRHAATSSRSRYIFTDVQDLDITDIEAIRSLVRSEQVDVVINCAAYTQVDHAEDDKETSAQINNHAVRHLATVCQEAGSTLIHISTDYVFDGETHRPYCEDHPTNPIGVYGQTKREGEEAVVQAAGKYVIIRTSWLYSTHGANFVKTMQRLTSERDSLNVVFDQIGTPTYAFDLASAIYQIVEKELYVDHSGIYHYSNEGVCSWYDFATAIKSLCGNRCDIKPCHSDEFPSKVKRPHFSVLDKSKFKATFQLTIPHWQESLAKYFEHSSLQ